MASLVDHITMTVSLIFAIIFLFMMIAQFIETKNMIIQSLGKTITVLNRKITTIEKENENRKKRYTEELENIKRNINMLIAKNEENT
jgi:predicted PurR-regulated permease PerM